MKTKLLAVLTMIGTEETAQAGEYKIVLEHPKMLLYRDEDGELQRFRFGEGRGNGLSFTCELTIE